MQAPVTPLSSQVRVEPSAIQAPGNAPPSSDPGAITAPSSPAQPSTTAAPQAQAGTGFSSGTSLTNTTNTTVSSQGVSAPTVGVQSFSVANATTATSSSTAQPAPIKPVSSQPTQQFSSQINLEPPSSVLPASITPLSASSITAPSSFTPVLPASGEISSIVAPGSSSVPIVGATPSSGTGTIVPPSSSVVPPGGSSGGIVKPGGGAGVVKPLYYFEGENGGACDSNVQYSEIVRNGRVDKPQECLRPRDVDAYNKSKQLENEAKTGGDSASRGKAREEVEFRDAQILAGYMCYKEGGGSESARGDCKDYVAKMRKSPMYESIGSSPAMWVNMQGDLIAGRLGRERLEALTWAFEHTKLEVRGNRQVLVGVGRNGAPAKITFPSYLLGSLSTAVRTSAVGATQTGMGIGYARVMGGLSGALTLLTLTGDSAPWYEGMSGLDAVRIAELMGTLFDDNSKQAKVSAPNQGSSRDVEARLDSTGKVHNDLPKVDELGQYDREELERLLEELRVSVQTRIQATVRLGANAGHNARLAEEQQLIKSLEKFLGK